MDFYAERETFRQTPHPQGVPNDFFMEILFCSFVSQNKTSANKKKENEDAPTNEKY